MPPVPEPGRQSLSLWIPFGFVIVCAEIVVLVQGSLLLGVSATGSRGGAWALWGLVCLANVSIACVRGGRITGGRDDLPVLASGVVFLGAGALLAFFTPYQMLMRVVNGGTDFTRHVLILGQSLSPTGFTYDAPDVFLNYPRGLHLLVGSVWMASGGERFLDAWLALEGTAWLLLTLLVMALVGIASRSAESVGIKPWLSQWVGPLVVMASFVLGMWLSNMLAVGFVTSIVAGLCLAAICAVGTFHPWFGRWEAPAALAAAFVVTCHSWPPVTAAVLVTLVGSLVVWVWKQRPRLSHILAMFVLVFVALLSSVQTIAARLAPADTAADLVDVSGAPGVTWPGVVWWGLAVAAIFMAALAWRRGQRNWVVVWALLTVSMTSVVLALLILSDRPWSKPSYYAIKTLWASSVLVLPVGIAGFIWVINGISLSVRRIPRPMPRLIIASTLIGLAVIGVASVAGQTAGQETTWDVLRGRNGVLPIQAITATKLEELGFKRGEVGSEPPILVWGMDPWLSDVEVALGWAQRYDASAWEATRWFNNGTVFENHQTSVREACEALRLHPDTIRITGPNPVTGADWLIAGGCPPGVVQPSKWIRVQIDARDWQPDGVPKELADYPTYDEVQQIIKQAMQGRKTAPVAGPASDSLTR